MKTNSVSLIIPCYNEEPNIKEGTLLKVAEYTKSDDRFGEVLIVDDGSTDKSRALIEKQFLPKYPKLRLIKNNHAGKAFAVITGIKESSHDYVFFSDFDLATPIEECEKLFAEVDKGNHVVIGSRSANREGAPLLRKTMALGFMISRNIIIGLRGITDTQCGFKIFDRRVALEIIDKLHVFKQEHVITTPSVTAGFDIEAHRLAPYPPPREGLHPRGTEVSVVLDLMIHDIEVILHLVRSEVTEVRAVGVPVLSPSEDIANVRLEFANGCVANITASRISPERMRKIRVFFDDAYLSLDYQEQSGELHRRTATGIVREEVPIDKGDALTLELASFTDCERPPNPNG